MVTPGKKVTESGLQVPQQLLNRNTANLVQPCIFWLHLERSQHGVSFVGSRPASVPLTMHPYASAAYGCRQNGYIRMFWQEFPFAVVSDKTENNKRVYVPFAWNCQTM